MPRCLCGAQQRHLRKDQSGIRHHQQRRPMPIEQSLGAQDARPADRSRRSASTDAASTAPRTAATAFLSGSQRTTPLASGFGAANLHRLGDARLEIAGLHQRQQARLEACRPVRRQFFERDPRMGELADEPRVVDEWRCQHDLQRPDPPRARATGFRSAGCCRRRRHAAPTRARWCSVRPVPRDDRTRTAATPGRLLRRPGSRRRRRARSPRSAVRR